LGDVASGAESTMEVRYVRDVERAHGLPRGERQVSASPTSAARHDIGYRDQRVLVELDGELGHEGRGARIRDGRRDRRGATTGWLTARAFWPDVLDPCSLANEVGAILQTRGWSGQPRICRRRPCLVH
jgi:very-short-patch-repair endonuclease